MTILVDARPLADPAEGGVTRIAQGLLPELVSAMPETTFVLATTGWSNHSGFHKRASEKNRMQNAEYAHFPLPNKLWSVASMLGIAPFERLAAKYRPDLLFLPNIGFVGCPRIPYALVVHDISFLIEPRWFTRKARLWHGAVRAERLIKKARWLFAVSERTKEDLIERLGIRPERVAVIPPGLTWRQAAIHDPKAAGRYGLPPPLDGRRYVLALGANDPRKNIGCASAAVKALRQDPRFADVALVMVGAKARNTRNAPCEMRLQHPTDDGLAALFRHASAFLYPSWYEGFGLPLHEAARFGTPCISSTAGALPETAPKNVLFASPAKPHHWTLALETILTRPDRYRTRTAIGDWSAAARIVKISLTEASH